MLHIGLLSLLRWVPSEVTVQKCDPGLATDKVLFCLLLMKKSLVCLEGKYIMEDFVHLTPCLSWS